MYSLRKRTVALVLLSLFTLMFLAAGTYYVDWTPGDNFSDSMYLRYRINGEKWKTVEDPSSVITSVVFHKENKLVIETSEDEEYWENTLTSKLSVIDSGSSDQYRLSWKWNQVPGAQSVRYRKDNEGWVYMGNMSEGITEDVVPNTLTVINVQSSVDGSDWLEGKTIGFLAAEKQPIPKTRMLMISVLGGAEFEDIYFVSSKSALRSSIGWGGKLTLSLPLTNTFAFSADNQFSLYSLGRFRYIQYDPSLKFRFSPYTERGLSPYLMIGGGVSILYRESRFYFYPLVSLDLGFDYWFSKAFALSVNACGSATIQKDNILNPGAVIDSIGLHASGSVGFTYSICKKGGER